MKSIFTSFLNVRLQVVMALGFIALILACDEADRSLLSFFGEKAMAVAIALAAYKLAQHWHARGYFKDVEEFCEED